MACPVLTGNYQGISQRPPFAILSAVEESALGEARSFRYDLGSLAGSKLCQLRQLIPRLAGVQRFRGERHGLRDAIRASRNHQSRSGVQEHNITSCRALAIENSPNDLRVCLGVAALDRRDGSAAQAKFLRRDVVGAN